MVTKHHSDRRSTCIRRLTCGLIIALALAVGLVLAAASAYAGRYDSSGYSITIALANGPNFTYGQSPAPIFKGTITIPSGATFNYVAFSVVADGTNLGGEVAEVNATTYDYTTYSNGFPAGKTTVTAYYGYSGTYVDSSVTVTVAKGTATVECQQPFVPDLVKLGQAMTLDVIAWSTGPSVDIQDATYNVYFTGPMAVTYTHLKLNSNNQLTMPAPPAIGVFQVTCRFNGTQNFQPAQSTPISITVSEEHPLAGIQIYTIPTTLQSGKSWKAYIVLQGQPGLPAPTGGVGVGNQGHPCYLASFSIGANGATLVKFPVIPSRCNVGSFWLGYPGDPYYNATYVPFPPSNPPIPASVLSGASSSNSGNGATGQQMPTSTPRPTATTASTPASGQAIAATTPATTTPATTVASVSTSSGSGIPFWPIAILAALLLGSGTVGFLFFSRRAKALAGVASTAPGSAPTPMGSLPSNGAPPGSGEG